MNELDRRKILNAGFDIYRCSEVEHCIKRRKKDDESWKIMSRLKTKKEIRAIHKSLLEDPFVVQD